MARNRWAIAQHGWTNAQGESISGYGDGLTSPTYGLHSVYETKAEALAAVKEVRAAVDQERHAFLLQYGPCGHGPFEAYTVRQFDAADFLSEMDRLYMTRDQMRKEVIDTIRTRQNA